MGWFRSTTVPKGGVTPTFEDRLAQIGPGVPGHCPSCDGLGYIDDIDIGHRYQIQHCKDCLHRWEYIFDSDGSVIDLTELDDGGRPVRRSRVRADPVLPTTPTDGSDAVLDLRDATRPETPVSDLAEPTQLAPGAWLRRSIRR